MRNRVWLLAVLAVCGCTTHLRPTAIAPPPGARPPLAVDGPVAVRAGTVDPEPHRFSLGSGFSARVHYADYTQAAVRLIAAELARQGVRVGEGGRSLEIAVQYVTYVHRAGDSACVIDFAVGMGEGRRRGIQTQGRAWTIGGACDEALTNMVTETLGNPWVVRYLTRP